MKNTKRLLIFILSLFAIFAFSFANVYAEGEEEGGNTDPGTQEPTDPQQPDPEISISLDPETGELEVGQTLTITATVENKGDNEIVWISSDDKVATVTDGTVTAVSAGYATITAKVADIQATCTIHVNAKEEAVTDYKLVITGGNLDKKFDKDVLEYVVNVTDISKLDIDVAPENAKKNIPSYSNIKNGSSIKVTIEGKQYTLTFNVPEANTNLSSLKITGQSFNQAFDKDTVSYTITVPYEINEIEIVATAEDSNATVKGTGYKDLSVGSTTFTITVTNGNATKTYRIFVTREEDEEETTGDKKKTKKKIIKSGSTSTEFDIPDVDDPDSTLNMIIITFGSIILFVSGLLGLYFYFKTSPRRLKKEIMKKKNKIQESPIVEIETPSDNTITDDETI